MNTFLDLIDPSMLDRIEVLRGTSSAQYGSDALGGSIQFLTNVPALWLHRRQPTFGGTVDAWQRRALIRAASAGCRFRTDGSGLVCGRASPARKTGDYRPGGGADSHAAVLRFFGVTSDRLYPTRMPDTGFHQIDATHVRANWVPSSNLLFTANYMRTRQDGANRWDQLLGGDGNLIAELNGLQLDLFYARLERLRRRLVRPGLADLFDQHAARGAGQSGRQR